MIFFIADKPTPILNTPHFDEVYGKELPFDEKGLVRALEWIAFPGTCFTVLGEVKKSILEVTTSMYPSKISTYVDRRCGDFSFERKLFLKKEMPQEEILLQRLLSRRGLPYVWGGNWSKGLPHWEKWYPPPKKLTSFEHSHWTLQGLDCSGLLFEVTEGLTPRNTSELMSYGIEVDLEAIKPLDLILYPGHVIIALSPTEVIESLYGKGVIVSLLHERVFQIEKPFTVRRFLRRSQGIV